MRKLILTTVAFIAIISLAHSQKLQLPLKDNKVMFEGSIELPKTTDADGLCKKVKSWIIETTGSRNYNVSTEKSSDCFIEVEVSNVMEPNGLFNDVESFYVISFQVNSDRIDYQVKNIFFKKAYGKYDITSVYNSYLKDQPYVKEKNESKADALKRHEYLMNLLNNNITSLINSFSGYMNVTTNAVTVN